MEKQKNSKKSIPFSVVLQLNLKFLVMFLLVANVLVMLTSSTLFVILFGLLFSHLLLMWINDHFTM